MLPGERRGPRPASARPASSGSWTSSGPRGWRSVRRSRSSPRRPAVPGPRAHIGTPEGEHPPLHRQRPRHARGRVPRDDPQNKVRLGPVVITGDNVERAFAELGGGSATDPTQWRVNFDFDGPGSDRLRRGHDAASTLPLPQNQLAIVVDRQVVSNHGQRADHGGYGHDQRRVHEQSAKDLATLLNAGSLPVELTQESVRTVSPTLGAESLRPGRGRGYRGAILLFAYLLFYYRLLGVVAWFGMEIWAVLALAIVSLAGQGRLRLDPGRCGGSRHLAGGHGRLLHRVLREAEG